MKMKLHGFIVNVSHTRLAISRLLVRLLAVALLCLGPSASEAASRPDENGSTVSPALITSPRPAIQTSSRKRATASSSRRRTRRRRNRVRTIVTTTSAPTSATVPVVGGMPPGEEAPSVGGAASPSIKPPMARSEDGTVGVQSSSPRIVNGGVLNGRAVSLPRPPYPPIARAARASGTVVVQVLIDEDGNVISAKAVSGHPLLQSAAVQAARNAKFRQVLLEGQPVRLTGTITYNFVL